MKEKPNKQEQLDIIKDEKDNLIHAKKKLPKWLRISLKVMLGVFCGIIGVVIIYVAYVFIDYHRIDDYQVLEVNNKQVVKEKASLDTEYTIIIQNMGFGAYVADFTFFMDGGKESRARSAESVKMCFDEGMKLIGDYDPDFVLIQEADINSTRSYKINQIDLMDKYFVDYASNYAINYDSPYLMYPIFEPHGKSVSSIATYTKIQMDSALRRSLPVSKTVSKLLDLDRCYAKTKIKIDNGKYLVLYNVHLSAYGSGDEVRTGQITMLLADMQAEFADGNYCVCGGDFNHDFTGDSVKTINGDVDTSSLGWAYPFPTEILDQYPNIKRAMQYQDGLILPTCRNCDVPYVEGNFTIIVDGYLVSDNIEVTYLENIQTGFTYSDHCPVVMKFILKGE